MSEHDEQVAVVSWFKLQYPQHHLIANANGAWIAGEGKRKYALINKYKKEGMTPGVSDLFLCVARGGYHGLWIEMKDKGKTFASVSIEQRSWMLHMNLAGYLAKWAAGFEEAKVILEDYLRGGDSTAHNEAIEELIELTKEALAYVPEYFDMKWEISKRFHEITDGGKLFKCCAEKTASYPD